MKSIKVFILAVSAISLCVSCAKDVVDEAPSLEQKVVFNASVEKIQTKTTLSDGDILKWSEGDIVSINGENVAITPSVDGITATFSAESAAEYEAFFPSAIAAGRLGVTTYSEGRFDMPMYAYSTSEELYFKNLCGVFELVIENSALADVKSISISSANKAMSGQFIAQADGDAYYAELSNANAVSAEADLICTTPASKSSRFYIPVPAQTYEQIRFTVTDSEGVSKYMQTRAGVQIDIERNNIYEIAFGDGAQNVPTVAISLLSSSDSNNERH